MEEGGFGYAREGDSCSVTALREWYRLSVGDINDARWKAGQTQPQLDIMERNWGEFVLIVHDAEEIIVV